MPSKDSLLKGIPISCPLQRPGEFLLHFNEDIEGDAREIDVDYPGDVRFCPPSTISIVSTFLPAINYFQLLSIVVPMHNIQKFA